MKKLTPLQIFKSIFTGILFLPIILIIIAITIIFCIVIAISKLFNKGGLNNSINSIADKLTIFSAKCGNAKAMIKIADKVKNTPAARFYDKVEAGELYLQAAEMGEPEGFAKVGFMHLYGEGMPQDGEKAFKYFNEAEKYGSALGKYGCGICYYKGIGIQKNTSKAFQLITEAMQLGLPLKEKSEAYGILGKCHYYGEGTQTDINKAFEYMSKTPDDNEFLIGECHFHGLGTEKNIDKAEQWYIKACDKGIPEAMDALGDIYYFGLGKNHSKEKAYELYENAARKNCLQSILKAALINNENKSEEGIKKADRFFRKYESYLREAIKSGGNQAYYYLLLGIAYSEGWGTPNNIHEAYFCFDRSLEFSGENLKLKALSLFCLYVCHKAGATSKSSYNEKDKLSELLQSNGFYRLAYILDNNNNENSRTLLKKSAESGNPASMHDEAIILLQEEKYDEALKLLSLAADKGYMYSMIKLSECFEKGIGTETDKSYSEEYRKKGESISIDMFSPVMMCEKFFTKYASDNQSSSVKSIFLP